MPSDEIPNAIWSGTFTVFGVEMRCHTLSNGKRIIEEDSFHAFMERLFDTPAVELGDADEFIRWQKGRSHAE